MATGTAAGEQGARLWPQTGQMLASETPWPSTSAPKQAGRHPVSLTAIKSGLVSQVSFPPFTSCTRSGQVFLKLLR